MVTSDELESPMLSLAALRSAAKAADAGASGFPAETATDLWRELALARWSIIDAFEADGRRFLVARPTAEAEQRSLAVDTRDRIILMERATGSSLKVIASEVGLSISTVARRLRRAMGRLGLRNAADLAFIFRAVAR